MNYWKEKYNEQVFGGAEGAENVVNSTKLAIQNDIRGLYIGPCISMFGHAHVEPWMQANILAAQKIWEAAHS